MNKFLIIPQADRLEDSIALAKKYGFGFEYNDFFSPEVLDNPKLCEKLINRYITSDIPDCCTLHGDFFDVLIFSRDEKIREISKLRIRQSLDTARRLKVKGCVFHTNYTPAFTSMQPYADSWIDLNAQFWNEILPQYSGLEIYMENMCDSSPDMLAALAKRLRHHNNFGICFDYAHAAVFGDDIHNWVKAVSPYTKHLHINDNDLTHDQHLAVGDGKIDWTEFKAYLNGYFDNCTVLIETSSLEGQEKSAVYLKKLGII